MASQLTLSPQQELHLQTAFLLSHAVDQFDPVLELKEKLALHNIAEYFIYDGGPCRVLVALSSNAIQFGTGTRSNFQITPTVFLAFSNSLRHAIHDIPGQSSMVNFLAAQQPCAFPGATGCHVHGHALAALESIPLGTVFNLLGQGYKLVTTGFKFGGMVAHLFAVRVLLQLHQEVQLAKQMGINLSMTLADNKVSSYAFGSPFFATSSLTRTLTSMDLLPNQQLNLHTLWRAGDGSPAFFAAASELYTVAAAARDAAMESLNGTDGITGSSGDVVFNAEESVGPASLARTPQLQAVQDWCRHVGDGVDVTGRCRASGPSRLMARPLDTALLASVAGPGGFVAAMAAGAAAGRRAPAGGHAAAAAANAGSASDKGHPQGDGGRPGSSSRSSLLASRTSSVTGRTPSLTLGSSRPSAVRLDAAAAAAAAGAGGGPSPSPTRVRRTPSITMPVGTRSVTGGPASRQQASRPTSWRDGLLKLLQVMGDGLGERYAPVGQFWILGTAPTDKAQATACGQPGTTLQPVEGTRAMQSSAAWLSPGNAVALFARWESELVELEKDLMEAFPWISFAPTVELRGVAVSRRDVLRESAALDLSA